MNITLTSVNNLSYKPLADITCTNKETYANLHGYKYFWKQDNFKYIPDNNLQPWPNKVGWERMNTVLELLENSTIDYVWLSDCDSYITNNKIKLESIIDTYDNHIIISSDERYVGVGQMFIKNSTTSKDFLRNILTKTNEYNDESQYFIHGAAEYKDIISITPQYIMNSYDYKRSPNPNDIVNDILGYNGKWMPEHFLIHWTGCNLETRINLSSLYRSLLNNALSKEDFDSQLSNIYEKNTGYV